MKTRILLISCLLILPSVVLGQRLENPKEVLSKKEITLDEAILFAHMNNLSINAAQNQINAAVHRRKAAWGLGAPKLSVGATYTFMAKDVGYFDFNGQKNEFVGILQQLPLPLPEPIITGLKNLDLSYTLQKRDFGVVDATLVVPIFTGGKINAAYKAAKIGVDQAVNNMYETSNKLFTEVAEFYWGLTLANNIEKLQADFVKSMALHASNASKLEKNGIIAHGERLFADMALSQAKAAFVGAQGNVKTVNGALGSALGEKGIYNPTTPLFINRNFLPLAYFQEQTLNNSHLLEKLELAKKLSEQAVKFERADFFPTIGAMGTANVWSYNLTDLLPRWTVGATVRWNLFNGLTREHNYAAAREQVRQVEALQAKSQLDIQTLVEKLYNQMVSAIAQYDASKATINFAQAYLEVQMKAFAEGMATSSNVVDAHLNLNKARLERMAAAYSFDVSLAQLLALSGLPEKFGEYQMGAGYEQVK